ncbi:MAG TPA: VIT family protein [Longimicrobiales bacterium]
MGDIELPDTEHHRSHRIGWLRAAVLGANDGIISTASIVVGVAAAETGRSNVLIAGMAGLVAGAMAMATGEYVSVSSQADTEQADIEMERAELVRNPAGELRELAAIYETRGLDAPLAMQVAEALSRHDALGAHIRDEIGLTEVHTARPLQAAVASAAAFAVGGALPLVTAMLAPPHNISTPVSIASLMFLAVLGGVAARAGGASMLRGAVRVTFWGALGMALSALVGKFTGTIF